MNVITAVVAVFILAGEARAQCKPPFILVPDTDNDGETPVPLCMFCHDTGGQVLHAVAEQQCRELNATLTSVHSDLQQAVVASCGPDAWIGLFVDTDDGNAPSWNDGSSASDYPPPGGNIVTNLGAPQTGHCNHWNVGVGKWDDRGCTASGDYVCSQLVAMCPVLEVPENGLAVEYSNDQYQDSVATHQCKTGYKLQGGDATRTCLTIGQWSGGEPACDILDCGAPPEIANGAVEFVLTVFGAEAQYSCGVGYILDGDVTATCSDVAGTATWATVSVCTESAIECGKPGVPDNGNVVAPNFKVNQEITYGCEDGYTLSGSDSATCLTSALWSPTAPTCEPLNGGDEENDNRSLIIGVAVGGVAFLALLATGVLLCLRARAPASGAYPAPAPAMQPPPPQPYGPQLPPQGYGPVYPRRYPAVGYY